MTDKFERIQEAQKQVYKEMALQMNSEELGEKGIVLANRQVSTKDVKQGELFEEEEYVDEYLDNCSLKIIDYPMSAILEINGVKYTYAFLQAMANSDVLRENKPVMISNRESGGVNLKGLISGVIHRGEYYDVEFTDEEIKRLLDANRKKT